MSISNIVELLIVPLHNETQWFPCSLSSTLMTVVHLESQIPRTNNSTTLYREVALRDGRPLVICPFALQHAGHGNAHFVAAGMTALAYRFGLLPVVPCRKNGKLNTSPFQNFHCVDEKRVKWKGT